jgi:hypothetical protein
MSGLIWTLQGETREPDERFTNKALGLEERPLWALGKIP